MKKILITIMLIALPFALSACKDDTLELTTDFSYYEQKLSQNSDYNTELFYLNTLDFEIADPSVIYIDEGEDEGYFYAYGTSDDIRVLGFQSFRSKDLTHWESMGVAFKPDFNETWSTANYWAPEVLYDPTDGLYYMFYSAQTDTDGTFQMSVAYSEHPSGPFITPNNFRNADGQMLSQDKPVYNLQSSNTLIDSSIVRLNAIDISPFIDPQTGDKYLYFSYFDSFNQSEIFGMKMKDWFTADYSTLKQITAVGFTTVEAAKNNDMSKSTPEGTINEGPFMIYENGIYYLTLSVYGFTDEKYQVRQALSDAPLGNFTKSLPEEGGTVIATDPNWSHLTSAGHHAFIHVGDELYIAYHTFLNRTDITDGRALAVDKVEFVSHNGTTLLHANGPTDSLQPLPEAISGYKNIAKDAVITSDNTKSDSNVSYLNDGVMSYLEYDSIPEYISNEGVTTITLTWDDFVTARALMIYNSIQYDKSFLDIARVRMTYLAEDNKLKQVEMTNLEYDWDFLVDDSFGTMNPGGAIVTEFNDITIQKIEITYRSVAGSLVGIPEIVVLGKEESSGVTTLNDYSYQNPTFASPQLITEGTTIGSVEGLTTDFGYDLTNDNGEENATIIQNWPYDQYAYFNNIYSTKFYVEAEFTVTSNHPYANDPYPKFGLTVGTNENTIFFFVDADQSYTKDSIGVAQRTFDNRDWDWNTTEQNVSGTGVSYTDGEYVKLSILRDGDEFYMFANDELYIYYDQFNIFVEDYEAAVGFLTFNTEVEIKNYYATDDETTVNQIISENANKINGATFGTANGYKTTSGWDLTTDIDECSTIRNSSVGDQYIYFKDYFGSTFYVETSVTVTESFNDPYPKFGIVLRNEETEFFFYIDSNQTYTSDIVGYVQKINGQWDWSNASSINVSDIDYRNGAYTTLALYRNNEELILIVNNTQVASLQNLLHINTENTVVGLLSFTTGIEITNYKLLLDEIAIQEELNEVNK